MVRLLGELDQIQRPPSEKHLQTSFSMQGQGRSAKQMSNLHGPNITETCGLHESPAPAAWKAMRVRPGCRSAGHPWDDAEIAEIGVDPTTSTLLLNADIR